MVKSKIASVWQKRIGDEPSGIKNMDLETEEVSDTGVMTDVDIDEVISRSFKLNFTHHSPSPTNKRGHSGVFCDYESGDWNYRQFVSWINEHIMSFALSPKELVDLGDRNVAEKMERAASNVYGRKNKVERRGEIGELILHGLVRDVFGTKPLISKLYFKTAPGETVKGADCVHIVEVDEEIESLWLGEAKFYRDGNAGVEAAVASVKDMLTRFKDRQEFVVIRNHLDGSDPIMQKAEQLLSDAVSLDKIRAKITIPILVTYESEVTQRHTADSDTFRRELRAELMPFISKYIEDTADIEEVELHIFLMPLKSKADLVGLFDRYVDGKRAIEI